MIFEEQSIVTEFEKLVVTRLFGIALFHQIAQLRSVLLHLFDSFFV
jgi:hypothetical protein